MKFYSVWTSAVVWRARPSCIAGRSAYCLGHIKAGRAGDKALQLSPTSYCRAHILTDHVIDASRDVVWCSSRKWDKDMHTQSPHVQSKHVQHTLSYMYTISELELELCVTFAINNFACIWNWFLFLSLSSNNSDISLCFFNHTFTIAVLNTV